MSSSPHLRFLPALVLLLAALPLGASTAPGRLPFTQRPIAAFASPEIDNASSILDSLREDVAQHPNDYLPFETQAAAQRFLADHADARRETDRAMIQRGVLGYAHGKAVVVVPSLSPSSRLRTAR